MINESDTAPDRAPDRDPGLIPMLGRSPGEGNGSSAQYSCLENPMDKRAWQAICSPWGCKELNVTEQLTLSLSIWSSHLRTGCLNLSKEYVKAVYCHPAYLTYAEYTMRNAGLEEAQARINIAKRKYQ